MPTDLFAVLPPGTVYLFCQRKVMPRDVKDACTVGQRLPVLVQDPWMWPSKSDFYVVHTKLSRQIEASAAIIGAEIICLPRAGDKHSGKRTGLDYLHDQVVKRVTAERDVYVFQPVSTGGLP